MKKTILFAAMTAIILLSSCKKDNSSTQSQGALPKTYTEDIRSSVVGNSVTVYNLSYDGDGRLVSLVTSDVPASLKFAYAYASDNTFTLDLSEFGQPDIHEKFWLNSMSLVDSTFQYNNTNDTSTEKYIYNSDKQLIQKKNYAYYSSTSYLNSTTNYTYDNLGDATTEADDQGNTTTYTYYNDLPYTLNLGQPYLQRPVHFIKTTTHDSGGSSENATDFYTFDSSNRLEKDSISTTGSDLIVIKSYTY